MASSPPGITEGAMEKCLPYLRAPGLGAEHIVGELLLCGSKISTAGPCPSEDLVGGRYADMHLEQEVLHEYVLDQSGYSCVYLQHLVHQHRGSGQCVSE